MKPLADEYLAILDAVRAQDTNRQLQAGWANRAWASVVANCLSTLGDEITLQRLGLLSPYLDVEHDEEDGLKLKQMIVSVASQRCWSMAVHSELCPDQWLGLLDTNPKASQLAHAQMQSDFRIVEKATQLSSMAPDLRTREARCSWKPKFRLCVLVLSLHPPFATLLSSPSFPLVAPLLWNL